MRNETKHRPARLLLVEDTRALADWLGRRLRACVYAVDVSREVQGIVSTGVYDDTWEKRNGIWKCLERTATVDPNWPMQTFKPYVDCAGELFRAS